MPIRTLALAAAMSTAALLAPALAQTPPPAAGQPAPAAEPQLRGFWITTPHPELTIRPGETASIPVTLRNANLPPQRAELEVTGVPEGWEWSLRGGNREVGAVMVPPDATEEVKLELTPAEGAGGGEAVPITVRAVHGEGAAELPLLVSLSDRTQGGLELKADLPALRGSATTTFSFKVEVKNDSAEETLVNLVANVPDGFQTKFKRGFGSEEITGLPIEAGATEDITLEVTPPRSAPAGRYPVVMEVAGGGATATAELGIEVTGQPRLAISGPQERLSGEAVAGQEETFPFTLVNSGSAPATNIELSASQPSGWKVEFEPERLDMIAPNAVGEVNVKITPSERAIAGDYMVTVRANGGGVSESAQFRVTVNTSTVWGVAGVGVIAAAVLVLGMAVMRYGRR